MAKEEIKKPAEEQIKFLGKEAVKTVKTDGTVTVRMNKSAYTELLEAEGITKEVAETVTNGLQKITSLAVKEAKDLCKKAKGATVVATLGSGPFSQDIKFIGKKEFNGHNPQTKEAIHTVKYGVVEATLHMPWGKTMKGEDGELAKYSQEMDDFFNKKK